MLKKLNIVILCAGKSIRNKSFMIKAKHTDKICVDSTKIKYFYYTNNL